MDAAVHMGPGPFASIGLSKLDACERPVYTMADERNCRVFSLLLLAPAEEATLQTRFLSLDHPKRSPRASHRTKTPRSPFTSLR